jgi:hypothetical protein
MKLQCNPLAESGFRAFNAVIETYEDARFSKLLAEDECANIVKQLK